MICIDTVDEEVCFTIHTWHDVYQSLLLYYKSCISVCCICVKACVHRRPFTSLCVLSEFECMLRASLGYTTNKYIKNWSSTVC